jgi:3-oxoisoapionate kinase
LLLSFYGDDLTGSTDAMEALTLAGVRTVLFMQPATPAQLARIDVAGSCRAVGLAGTSRSETPAWMDAHLPGAFGWLRSLGAPVCHYKVCSTFDSAPFVGSIGRALEIGLQIFEQPVAPVVVGVPQLRRFTVFGQHFATIDGQTHRLDRHPVMSLHPVTPMDEADLCRHLARQTTLPVDLIDWLALQEEGVDERMDAAMRSDGTAASGALLFDVPDRATQAAIGRQLWRMRREGTGLFCVGSSGVEYALVAEWRTRGLITEAEPPAPRVEAVDRIAVVSGSCSTVTAEQIRWAGQQGDFTLLKVDAARLASPTEGAAEQARVFDRARRALDAGHSVIAHTALGPESVTVRAADAEPHAIGRRLGQLLRDMVAHGRLTRAIVAGGDTASHALRELGVHALTVAMSMPRTPGAPLCTAHSEKAGFDGLQIALKGGQIGATDYFDAIRSGRAR